MGMDPADLRWQRWCDQLERISSEVFRLHHYRQLWRELAEITQTAALPPSLFFDALSVWYVSTQGAAVRRQVDRRKGTVSLRRLLEDIAWHPEVATRDRHLAQWNDLSWGPDLARANRTFDGVAGAGRDRIDPARVRGDVTRLVKASDVVKTYVDETIAHAADESKTGVPTYADLNAAIDVFAEIVGHYSLLLTASTIMQFEPVIQDDWKAPFRQPWIA